METRRRLVLVSPDATDASSLERLERLLPGLAPHVDTLILRWPSSMAGPLLAAARRLRTRAPDLPLLLRDRFDVASLAGLSGVQLPEDGIEATDVRSAWPGALIGVSRHDADGVGRRAAGADFALVSPVFATVSKPGHPGLGLEVLAALVRTCPVPVVALGGIGATDVARVLRTGAAGVAVRSGVFGAEDPVRAARELRRALDSAG